MLFGKGKGYYLGHFADIDVVSAVTTPVLGDYASGVGGKMFYFTDSGWIEVSEGSS